MQVVICITTGGGLGMTLEQRLSPVSHVQAGTRLLQRRIHQLRPGPRCGKDGRYEVRWEKPYLEMTRDFVFTNTFKGSSITSTP